MIESDNRRAVLILKLLYFHHMQQEFGKQIKWLYVWLVLTAIVGSVLKVKEETDHVDVCSFWWFFRLSQTSMKNMMILIYSCQRQQLNLPWRLSLVYRNPTPEQSGRKSFLLEKNIWKTSNYCPFLNNLHVFIKK